MPSAIPDASRPGNGITKLTNCRLVKGDRIVEEDLWISSHNGKILPSQQIFYEYQLMPERTIDLKGRLLAPGFIDVQFNGAYGFDFSVIPDDLADYAKGVRTLNRRLVNTGVTSYLPTIVSQKREVYHKALPYLGPSGASRLPSEGSESLGAHCEGPFISPTKSGIHSPEILEDAPKHDIEDYYGPHCFSSIRKITLAPEVDGMLNAIPFLVSRNTIVSIGHSEATYEEAKKAMHAGATMVTHLFNAMRPLHHRNPGVFGLLGTASPPTPPPTPQNPSSPEIKGQEKAAAPLITRGTSFSNGTSKRSSNTLPLPTNPTKPFFGLIADGIHLHPTTVQIAWAAHRRGCILVTDALAFMGLPDGVYDWTNGEKIRKAGSLLTLEGSTDPSSSSPDGQRIAGCAITLGECVSNFLNWSGATTCEAINCVTGTPARMLGLSGVKGCLEPDADADLVVLEEEIDEQGWKHLKVEQVWKFGERVFFDGEDEAA